MNLARPATVDLLAALTDARNVELEIFQGIADSQLLGRQAHFLEPPIWEIGHVGWFQEYWILRHLDRAETMLPGSDGIYDSFYVSYRLRWGHPYPSRGDTLSYISEVLERSIGRIEGREPSEEERYFYTLSALHEDMHAENLTLIQQTLAYPRPKLSSFERSAANPPVDEAYQPRDVAVPGGTFMLGAESGEPFVFDNEKWAHPVMLEPFRISSTPVTNAQFQAFVDDGGYRRREVWSAQGWDWRRRARIEHPLFWVADGRRWCEQVFDEVVQANPALLDHFPQLESRSPALFIGAPARPWLPAWLFPAMFDGLARRIGGAAWRLMQWTRRSKPDALARVAYVRATMRPYTLFDETHPT